MVAPAEVAQPLDAAAIRSCLLAMSVQAMEGVDTAIVLAANAQLGRKKHTSGRVQLQQESTCVLVRTKEKSVWETCLCLALLRAQAKES
jgi:hypothetical protein